MITTIDSPLLTKSYVGLLNSDENEVKAYWYERQLLILEERSNGTFFNINNIEFNTYYNTPRINTPYIGVFDSKEGGELLYSIKLEDPKDEGYWIGNGDKLALFEDYLEVNIL